MTNQTLPNDPLIKTHQFEFDINSISVDDLKKLYKHFHIEEFGDAAAANTQEEFYKCFIDDETNGNKDAFLFIRLTALLKCKCVKVKEIDFTTVAEKKLSLLELFVNKKYLFEFEALDYYDLNISDGGFNIVLIIQDYAVEDAIPFLENYEFLKSIQ